MSVENNKATILYAPPAYYFVLIVNMYFCLTCAQHIITPISIVHCALPNFYTVCTLPMRTARSNQDRVRLKPSMHPCTGRSGLRLFVLQNIVLACSPVAKTCGLVEDPQQYHAMFLSAPVDYIGYFFIKTHSLLKLLR